MSLIKGMKPEDKDFLYKFVEEKSETQFEYRHTFDIVENVLENQINDFDDITIIETIKHTITKVEKTENISKGIFSNLSYITETEELPKEIEEDVKEKLINKIKNNIEKNEFYVKDYQRVIERDKEFLKTEFKDYFRIKKLENIINTEQK